MLTVIKQCKHCGSRYTYHLSGEGCNSPLNNNEYCPTCYEVMMLALETIPVKYHAEYEEIDADEAIIKALRELKERHQRLVETNPFANTRKMVCHHGDEFIYNRGRYIYQDGKLYLRCECDESGKSTGNAWIEDDDYDRYIPTTTVSLTVPANEVQPMPLSPPSDKVVFNNITDLSKNVRLYKP